MKHLFSRSISSFVQGKIVLSQGHKCLFSFSRNAAFFSAKTGIKKIWQYFSLKLLLRFQTNDVREQGWRSGESARFPPMWPGFDSRTGRLYMDCVCCWFSSLLWKVFSGYCDFPLPLITQHFQFDPVCSKV